MKIMTEQLPIQERLRNTLYSGDLQAFVAQMAQAPPNYDYLAQLIDEGLFRDSYPTGFLMIAELDEVGLSCLKTVCESATLRQLLYAFKRSTSIYHSLHGLAPASPADGVAKTNMLMAMFPILGTVQTETRLRGQRQQAMQAMLPFLMGTHRRLIRDVPSWLHEVFASKTDILYVIFTMMMASSSSSSTE